MKNVIPVVVAALIILLFIASCSCSTPRPKTFTPAPALDGTRKSIVDSKDAIRRSRTLNQRIEDKLIILEGH